MLSSKKLMLVLGLLVIASMVLAACAPTTTEPETVVETVVITVETEGETVVQVVTPTPEPVDMPDTLVICMGQEPETLYVNGNSMLAMTSILEAVFYDGPGGVDARTFDYQPIIWEKLPSLADGDATLVEVTVTEGDTVVAADQSVITLDSTADPKQLIVVAGSTDPVEYTGGDVVMEQLSATFSLKPGLLWSDGTPLTSADSIYGYTVAGDPDTTLPKFVFERTASFEATDDVTLVWTGFPGYKDSTYYLNVWGPLPEHVWGQFTAAELLSAVDADIATNLVGYGPYKIVEWVKGDNVRAVKNENYWRAGEGLPKFDNLVFRFVGGNSNANIAAVLAGECDIVDQTAGMDDQSELLLELQAAGQLDATFVTGTTWEHTDFNIQHIDYDDGSTAGDRIDFFSDVRMRKAIAMCHDRQSVVDTVLFGQSIVLDTYIPPNHPLFNAEVVSYPFDPEGAKALMAEVGWTDTDGDGILDDGAGNKLAMTWETTNATLRQQYGQILADSLTQCGIEVTLNFYPANEWFADGPDGKLFGRRTDLGAFAWLTGVQPACELYKSDQVPGDPTATWISIMEPDVDGDGTPDERSFPSGWGGQNQTGFAMKEYDDACNLAITSLPGQPGYEEGHLESQRIFGENLPVVPLFLRLKLAATRPDMCNFFMDPTANSEMWNIEEFGYGPLCDG
jgi:peptide/nickel transport system substrate-binding protein